MKTGVFAYGRSAIFAAVWLLTAQFSPSIFAHSVVPQAFGISARVYLNPNTGRFWTMDTDEGDQEDPKSLHLYNYAEGDPVDNIDPSGNDIGEAIDVLGMSGTLAQMGFPVTSQVQNRAEQVAGNYVDIYVWDGSLISKIFKSNGSVGHVMATEHNSHEVILSQFPFKTPAHNEEEEGCYYHPGQGYNGKAEFYETYRFEKPRIPDHVYSVLVPSIFMFNAEASQQRNKQFWFFNPRWPDTTSCSTAIYLSLLDGGVPFSNAHHSGTLMPTTFDHWMATMAQNTTHTGVTENTSLRNQ